jgi:tetratricopeptide (TPR) repeat protein
VTQSSSSGRKLSIAVIARDAQATLAATLESVRSVADEIVVVDTGSADGTWEIAQRGASRVIDYPWADDFSAARNFALGQLTGDWVLWLDASEQLEAAAAQAIRQQIDSQPAAANAYLLQIKMPASNWQTDGEQAGRIRLWPLKAGLKFTGRVREQLTPAPAEAGLSPQITRWRILRSARDLQPQIKTAKAQRDIRLAEMEIQERGERLPLLLALGESWATLGEPVKAADWFRRAIAQSQGPTTEHLEAYYGLLTTFDSRPNSREEQVAACLEALKAFPLDAQLLCAMGSYMQSQGRLDLACRSYQVAVEHGQINQAAWHLANLEDVAIICYSLTLELQGRTEESCRVLASGLQARGSSKQLRQQLIELHVKHNRRQEALAEADRLPEQGILRDALRNAIRGACLAAQQQWAPAVPYLRRAYEAGCRHPICLRWLASALISTGDLSGAEPVLQIWQGVEPGHPEPHRLLELIAAQTAGGKTRDKTDDAPPKESTPQAKWRIINSSARPHPTKPASAASGTPHSDQELFTR